MKNFYKKYILPRFLNFGMKKGSLKEQRPSVVEEAAGVVLEIGFGSGLNLPYYKNIEKLYAVDPSKEMHNLAKEELKKVSFPVEYIQASAEKIPLPDNSVDAIVSTWSFCSIQSPGLALQEALRVLKPGGKFYFIEHGKSRVLGWIILQNIITPLSKNFTGNCHLNREIDKLVLESGFHLFKLETFPERCKPLNYIYKGMAEKL